MREGAICGQHPSDMTQAQGRSGLGDRVSLLTVPMIPWKSCFSSLGLSFYMCQAGSRGGVGPESL